MKAMGGNFRSPIPADIANRHIQLDLKEEEEELSSLEV